MFREDAKCQTPTPRLQIIPQRMATSWNHQRGSIAVLSPHSKGENNIPGIHPDDKGSHNTVSDTRSSRKGEGKSVGVGEFEGGDSK